MHLLHVVPTYLPAFRHGGPIVSVHGLCRALVRRGHRVSVFTTDVHGPGRLDVPLGSPVDRDGVQVCYFPIGRLGPLARLYRSPALGKALRRQLAQGPETAGAVDLVHLHSVFLWPTSAAARAAERRHVPYLLAPRGMLVPELIAERGRLRKSLWLGLVERRTIERAAVLHATTELEARDAERFGFRLPPVRVVPNGIDLAPFEADRGDDGRLGDSVRENVQGPPYLLALGRLSWKKGLDHLVRALALVSPTGDGSGAGAGPPLLVLAGPDEDGHRAELEALAAERGVAERVRFTGPVDGADKIALLRRAVALALPSRHENFANAVLEAMAAATPVVVTPQVGLAATVERAGAGLVVEPDPEALARAMATLLENPQAARDMGARGAEAARAFAWPSVAERMEAVYEEALKGLGGRWR